MQIGWTSSGGSRQGRWRLPPWLRDGALAGLVLLALLLTLARLWLPVGGAYRTDIERVLSGALHAQVRIGEVSSRLSGFTPALRLEQVGLLPEGSAGPPLRLRDVTLALDPLASLREWRLVPGVITLHLQRLELVRDAAGRWSVGGFSTPDAANAAESTPPLDLDQALAWLRRMPDVRVRADVLDLNLAGQPFLRERIEGASLALHNSGISHRAQLELNAASRLGKGLRVAVDAQLPDANPSAWDIRAHVQADDWRVPAWWALLAGAEFAPEQGVLDTSLWLEWREGRLQSLSGEWLAQSVHFPSGDEVFGVQRYGRAGARFDWQAPEPGRWYLRAGDVQFERNGHAWPTGTLEMAAAPGPNGRQILTGGMDFLLLEDVTPLLARLPLPLEQHALWLRRFAPRGEIRQLQFTLPLDPVQQLADGWFVQAEGRDLGLRPWGDVPGIAGVDARLAAGHDGGVAELAAEGVLLDPAALFRDPLVFSSLKGVVYWQRRGADWFVGSDALRAGNDHLAAGARFTLQLPADASEAALDLHAEVHDADPRYVPLYLPSGVLSPDAMAWLDRAFLGGRVPLVSVDFRGRFADFPFDIGEGKFRVAFNPEDGVLHYMPGWPLLEDLAGEVVFSGRRLDVSVRQGRVLGAALGPTRLNIADLDAANPMLDIVGEVNGPAQDLLVYLDQSGIGESYRDTLRASDMQGAARLVLDMRIPLGWGDPVLKGEVRLPGNSLHLKDWDIRLDDIAGSLHFTEDSIMARELSARIGGAPARIHARTEAGGARSNIIELETDTELQALAGRKAEGLARIVQGRTPWKVMLDMPQRQQAGRALAGRVRLHSPLTRARINLPPPWDETAARLGLSMEAALSGEDANLLRLSLGSEPGPQRIQALLQMQGQGASERLRRGVVQFGPGTPELPVQDGIAVRGELPLLDVPAWQQWQAAMTPPAKSAKSAKSPRPAEKPATGLEFPLLEVSLKAQQVRALSRLFGAMQLQARLEAGRYTLAVQGRDMQGSGHYDPAHGGSLALQMEHVFLPRADASPVSTPPEAPLDPRAAPLLDVRAAKFRYEDLDLGSLNLRTERAPDGQVLRELTLALKSGGLKATGGWLLEAGVPVLQLNGELHSEDFGATLSGLGFAGTVEGGKGELPFQLKVPGGPAKLGLDTLAGQVRLNMREGRLLDVEPGAGRVFGLLSFTTLTRRLRLDFTDLFGKGLAFDKIEGNFDLSGGNAYTNNMHLRGPSGQIDVVGRVGLSARNYDQTITVRPNLSASLPLAGVLTGGIGVGAALLLTHGLFKDPVNQITEFQYRVSGDWAKPEVDPVAKPGG
jgi:uncharacterized protein (TIGR02099 family)